MHTTQSAQNATRLSQPYHIKEFTHSPISNVHVENENTIHFARPVNKTCHKKAHNNTMPTMYHKTNGGRKHGKTHIKHTQQTSKKQHKEIIQRKLSLLPPNSELQKQWNEQQIEAKAVIEIMRQPKEKTKG